MHIPFDGFHFFHRRLKASSPTVSREILGCEDPPRQLGIGRHAMVAEILKNTCCRLQRLLSAMLLMLVLSFLAAPSVGSAATQPLKLDDAVRLAVEQNAGLASMKSHAAAMAEVPPQAGSLPDPTLSFKALNLPVDSFSTTQEAMTQMQIGIAQALPFPGKLSLRRQAASFEAEAAAFNVDEFRLRLVRNVRISWWNLFYLDRALEIIARNEDLLRQFITIAQTKYKVGKGLQQDVLLAQVELSKLLDIEIQLKGVRRDEEARLNALLNRPTHLPITIPDSVNEQLPELPEESELHQIALAERPLLKEKKRRIEASRSRVLLAEKDYYPDFKLGAAYGIRNGTNPSGGDRADFASFMLSMNLPIYTGSKQDRALAQAQAEMAREEFALQDAVEAVFSETSAALADYRKARDQAVLFKTGIIPQASQTVDSMLAGYQVNKVDFLNLVRSQITLYNYETQYWKALAEARQAMARLEAATATPIETIKKQENPHE